MTTDVNTNATQPTVDTQVLADAFNAFTASLPKSSNRKDWVAAHAQAEQNWKNHGRLTV